MFKVFKASSYKIVLYLPSPSSGIDTVSLYSDTTRHWEQVALRCKKLIWNIRTMSNSSWFVNNYKSETKSNTLVNNPDTGKNKHTKTEIHQLKFFFIQAVHPALLKPLEKSHRRNPLSTSSVLFSLWAQRVFFCVIALVPLRWNKQI